MKICALSGLLLLPLLTGCLSRRDYGAIDRLSYIVPDSGAHPYAATHTARNGQTMGWASGDGTSAYVVLVPSGLCEGNPPYVLVCPKRPGTCKLTGLQDEKEQFYDIQLASSQQAQACSNGRKHRFPNRPVQSDTDHCSGCNVTPAPASGAASSQ